MIAIARRCLGRAQESEIPDEDPRHELGRLGENLAARYLPRHEKLRPLYRNYRAPDGGEVDIVCRDLVSGELVFVEVKTRARQWPGLRPSDAVTPDKQRLIAVGALSWLRLLDNPDIAARFDIAEVHVVDRNAALRGEAKIELIRDAFPLPSPWFY